MMKYMYICLISSFLSYSQTENDVQKTNITKFINEFLITENYFTSFESLPEYVNADKKTYSELTQDQKRIVDNYVSEIIDALHKEMEKASFNYKLVNHYHVDKKILSKFNIIYEKLSSVYYLIANDVIITSFIVDDENRIISFSPHIGHYSYKYKKNEMFEPFMLNKIILND